MMELRFVQPDYEIRGSDPARIFDAAHRVTRMMIATAGIVEVPMKAYGRALDAMERVGKADADYTADEVVALAEVCEAVAAALAAALDEHHRPRGPDGEAILEEARRPLRLDDGTAEGVPDSDRVFVVEDDGSIGTVYPRMSIGTTRAQIAALAGFLREAADGGYGIAVLW